MNLYEEVDVLKILPPNLARDKNVQMMAEPFNEALRELITKIPDLAIIPRLTRREIIDHVLLDLLAWQFHCDFYDVDLSIEQKQTLILKSLDWHFKKGTPNVVEEIVTTVFADAEVDEWFNYKGLPYRFRVSTLFPVYDMAVVTQLVRAIASVKNTRSYLDAITAIIQAQLKIYYGVGLYCEDILNIKTRQIGDGQIEIYIGVIPSMGGGVHILAIEYEPYAYTGMYPRFTARIDIDSEEYDIDWEVA